MYVVQVNAPSTTLNTRWDYASGYFPRRFHYLKDAKACAYEAISKGATLARIEYPNGAEFDIRPNKSKENHDTQE